MSDTSTTTLLPNVRLGIRGLPNLTGNMVPGGLYVLVAENASARIALMANCLDTALRDGRRCFNVVPGNPELYLQRLESFPGLGIRTAFDKEQLRVFTMQEEFSKKMFRYGAERFVEELEHFEVQENDFLIFDQADDVIGLHDIALSLEQIDVLGKWLARRNVTALLVFLRITESHTGTLNALMDHLHGIMRIGGDEEGLRLTFDYWQSSEGTVAARHYQLSTLETNLYEASAKAAPSDAPPSETTVTEEPPPPQAAPTYFYMDPDLGSLAPGMQGEWIFVETLVGMMHATRNHRRAIAIFCYRQDSNLRQLAEAIHTLRINLGKYAQIIVQEKNASLRYQNEALLLRLGTNLVIHRDVQPARMPLMIDSMAGQVFNRDVDINFEAALASVSPTSLRGYQPPARFVREVSALVERAGTLNLPFALVVGTPVEGAAMLETLKALRVTRAGDLFSADNEQCYVFLNACQQAVVLATMERLVGGPLSTRLTDVRFLVAWDTIQHALNALSHNAEVGMVIDYSAELPPPAAASVPGAPPSLTEGADAPTATAPPLSSLGIATPPVARSATDATSAEVVPASSGGLYQRPPSNQSKFGREAAPRATRAVRPTPEASS